MTLLQRARSVRLSTIVAVVTILFLLAPFIVVMGASFDTGDGFRTSFPPRSPSLQWYAAISPKYVHAGWISFLVACAVAVLSAIVGTCAALGIVRGRVVAKDFFQSFFRLPVQIPLVVTGAVFLQFYYQLGTVTGLNFFTSVWGLIIAHLFIAIPYCVGCVSAVLVRMDTSLEEAAQSLGATHWSTFWKVMFPAMRPGVAAGMFYAFIVSFGDVPVAMFLVSGDNMTLPVQIFLDMQFDFRPDMLAVSTVMVIASVLVIIGAQRLAGLDMILPGGDK